MREDTIKEITHEIKLIRLEMDYINNAIARRIDELAKRIEKLEGENTATTEKAKYTRGQEVEVNMYGSHWTKGLYISYVAERCPHKVYSDKIGTVFTYMEHQVRPAEPK